MIFRVCRKLAKVIYLNGGKGKIRKKKCDILSEQIEKSIRNDSHDLDEYKEKIQRLVKCFDKNPDNVKKIVLRFANASNMVLLLQEIQKVVLNKDE